MKAGWIAVLLLLFAGCAAAHPAGQPAAGVGLDQHLGKRLPLEQRFVDEQQHAVKLGEYFGHRPVVLVFAYYDCPNLCDAVMSGALLGLQQSGLSAGRDYELVVVSFNPRNTPQQAADKKRMLLEHFAVPGARLHTHFLTGGQAAIDVVTRAAGFRYYYDARLKQYAHASGLLIAAPDGRLSRYFYGVRFAPRDLRLALVQAGDSRIGSPVDQLLLLCFHYDPRTGRYGVAITDVMRLAGVLAALLLGGYVGMTLVRERSKRR